jgi:hypothetical protein
LSGILNRFSILITLIFSGGFSITTGLADNKELNIFQFIVVVEYSTVVTIHKIIHKITNVVFIQLDVLYRIKKVYIGISGRSNGLPLDLLFSSL